MDLGSQEMQPLQREGEVQKIRLLPRPSEASESRSTQVHNSLSAYALPGSHSTGSTTWNQIANIV